MNYLKIYNPMKDVCNHNFVEYLVYMQRWHINGEMINKPEILTKRFDYFLGEIGKLNTACEGVFIP
jgi:hypothetical protein